MQIILQQRVEKLGHIGDVVQVKDGYARNYLLPRKIALRATKENLKYFETQRAQIEAQNIQKKQEAEKISERMQDLPITIIRQASETSQLYGSVKPNDIVSSLKEEGVTVQKSQVSINQPIKSLGIHPIQVKLHAEVSVKVLINVARSADEAQGQMKAYLQASAPRKKAATPGGSTSENTQNKIEKNIKSTAAEEAQNS